MSTTPAVPTLVQRGRLTALQQALESLRIGAASVTFEGRSYGESDLARLHVLLERVQVKAAIEAIEVGNQSYAINGLTYTRGDLRALYERDARLEARAARSARGGIRTRFGVGYG